ncbi:F-box/WD repeat-containing protein 5-like [Liolophura sinensis]|uniref:F-box/WD repeat-containing protein 5-like n=1 Tax=Liolophura sinensis TaxID=3198878 RepID=UPI0031580199
MEKSRRRKPIWQTAPDDLLIRVFSFLPARALLNVAQCCKNWFRVANDEFLWKDLFYRAWQIDPVIPRALGKSSWQGEFKRLAYHTPALESEVIKQHNDQVLHVSFAHNGSMFATSSKDGHIKVWNTSYPVSLRFQEDMKNFTWKYTQFSQFNESDTLLLVSGVHFESLSMSGEIAVFSLTDSFELQCRVINKPYDVFGTWYNESYLLSGNLYWLGHLVSCSALWLNKAFQAVDTEQESVVMRLFRFHNVNASSIRTIMIASCWNGTAGPPEETLEVDMASTLPPCQTWSCDHNKGLDDNCPGSRKMQNMRSFENGEFRSNILEVDQNEATDKLNGTIEYDAVYRRAENASKEDRQMDQNTESEESKLKTESLSVTASGSGTKAGTSRAPECPHSPAKFLRSNDIFHASASSSANIEEPVNFSPRFRGKFRHRSSIGSAPSPACEQTPSTSSQFCDKYLIFTTGSMTYTPHQIGIKRIRSLEPVQGTVCRTEHGVRLLPNVDENVYGNDPVGYSTVDQLINLHGHIIGMSLSPDHRYLYVNSRPWPKDYRIENPLYPPPIAQEIDIHVIDLVYMKEVGTMHRSHKAYTPNDECFFIFLDVCDEYVASGAEDRHGYLWDRHYGLCVRRYKHNDVVNAVAFNPKDPEMLVTVSDDATIKIWRSKNRERQVKLEDRSKMEYET